MGVGLLNLLKFILNGFYTSGALALLGSILPISLSVVLISSSYGRGLGTSQNLNGDLDGDVTEIRETFIGVLTNCIESTIYLDELGELVFFIYSMISIIYFYNLLNYYKQFFYNFYLL